MGTDNKSSLLQQLNWRYAVQKFDSGKKLPPEMWSVLKEAIVLSPSSYGLQPWKAVVILNKDIKKQLSMASYNQPQVESSSHFVVFAGKTDMTESYIDDYVKKMAETRELDVDALKSHRNHMVTDLVKGSRSRSIAAWAANQAYIALGNLTTSAAILGIDACPMEGIRQEKFDEILGLTGTGYKTVVACALGYRSAVDKYQNLKKVRWDKSFIIEERK